MARDPTEAAGHKPPYKDRSLFNVCLQQRVRRNSEAYLSNFREMIERVVASIMEENTDQFLRPYDIVLRIKAADALRSDADDSRFPATSLLCSLIRGYNIRPHDCARVL